MLIFLFLRMPKVVKRSTKKAFRLSVVKKHIKTWTNKAKELRNVASRSYRTIREYIPKHEDSLTESDKEELVDYISMT